MEGRHAGVGAAGNRGIASGVEPQRSRKARPERFRFTLRDDPAGAIPLELPSQRHWFAGIVFGIFFAAFATVAVGMLSRMSLHRTADVADLMMFLFDVFWLLGWSAGVLILGALTALFLFYRESARLEGGRLVHVPRLGPLKIVCEYDLAKMGNLRLEEGKNGEVRIRFDYGGRTGRIGDAMTGEDAEAVMKKIRRALPMSGRSTALTDPPSPSAPEPVPEIAAAPAPGIARAPTSTATLALVAANLLPLAGVLLLGWDLSQVMVLYWAESAVIGFYTALRLCVVAKWAAVFAVPFFVGHFGGFMAAHFLFIYGFFIRGFDSGPMDFGPLEGLIDIFGPVWPALVALFLSHGISFFVNFIGRQEYAGESVQTVMIAPYRRIVVMHLTIMLGAALVMFLGTPAPALALLVAIKTAADVRAHRREHALPKRSDEKE